MINFRIAEEVSLSDNKEIVYKFNTDSHEKTFSTGVLISP
jgi:hypothetical protein